MCPQTNQFDDIILFIEPNQKEIAANMTFHTAFIVTLKHVRTILGRKWNFGRQHVENNCKRLQFRVVVLIPFQIFPILS